MLETRKDKEVNPMKNKNRAEAQVLDRLMYLLEEESVGRLVDNDTDFAKFVEDLYGTLQTRTLTMQSRASLVA
jgi:hypothetical protein